MIAANLAMRASGARSTEEVPSDHGRLNSSLTSPSSRIFRRSLAQGGRKMYLHRFSRPFACFEPQHYPDTPNQPTFPPVVLVPGQTNKNTIINRISTTAP